MKHTHLKHTRQLSLVLFVSPSRDCLSSYRYTIITLPTSQLVSLSGVRVEFLRRAKSLPGSTGIPAEGGVRHCLALTTSQDDYV